MSSAQQLAELVTRNRSLEASLAEALQHPASTDDEITALKRLKLHTKDRMSALEQQLRDKESTPAN